MCHVRGKSPSQALAKRILKGRRHPGCGYVLCATAPLYLLSSLGNNEEQLLKNTELFVLQVSLYEFTFSPFS
ncbi:hypothetical protein MHYP_G00127150 [Metynnis hypsauchen]